MRLNWAERWAVNNPLRVFQQKWEIGWMKKNMPLPPRATVLEVGCGRGAGAGIIREGFRPTLFYAMDLDVQMVRRVRSYLPARQRKGISLYVGDVFRLPHRDHTLDAVFGFGVLHHVPDWQGALAEIARVLKIGGIYFSEEIFPSLYQNFITKHFLLHPRGNRFRGPDLKRSLNEGHLRLEKFFEFPPFGILAISVKKP
jgi:ubiquinone/menaquinone biosynthesis C-methylase UbiE